MSQSNRSRIAIVIAALVLQWQSHNDNHACRWLSHGLRYRELVRSVRLKRGAPISCRAVSRSLASMSSVTNLQSSISVDDSGPDSGLEDRHNHTLDEKTNRQTDDQTLHTGWWHSVMVSPLALFNKLNRHCPGYCLDEWLFADGKPSGCMASHLGRLSLLPSVGW